MPRLVLPSLLLAATLTAQQSNFRKSPETIKAEVEAEVIRARLELGSAQRMLARLPLSLEMRKLEAEAMLRAARAEATFAETESERARLGLESVLSAARAAAANADKDRARALWPDLNPASFTMAAYGAHAWDIDTDRLMQNFAREVRANGGTISTKAEVRAIRKTRSDWEVELTTGETITAQILVNAAGSWADRVAEMAGIPTIGFTPYRRSMGRIPAPGGADVSGWPMIFGAGETWYAKPDAGALIVSPAEEVLMEPHDAFADDMTLAEGIARYEEHMQTPVTRLLSSWAGLRTFAPDRQLVLGPDARDPSFVWSAGQGGYGFQTSPAASALVADLVAGRQPELDGKTVAALSPARFA